jgi:MraZ protein
MLIGTYYHQLDQKNRFRIPAKFKQILGDNIVITRGNGNQLFLFSSDELKRLVIDKTETISLFDEVGQRSVRLLLSSAFELEQDNQGRSLLPAALKKLASINKDIVSVGVGTRVELWSAEEWEKYSSGTSVDEEISKLKDYGV